MTDPSSAATALSTPAKSGGSGLLLNQPVVIDNGSSSIKAGFAGSDKPKVVIDTKVGRNKHLRVMPGGALDEGDRIYIGRKLNEHRGAFVLEHAMDHGVVQSWDAMERLWEHVYSPQCLNAKAEDHPLLITEAPLNPKSHRHQMAQILFETMHVPAIYFAAPSVLSLYASGRTTGIVLDVGEGVTHAVPVYEGFALQHSITRSNIAGRDVTRALQYQLRRHDLHLATTAEIDLCKRIKEECCYLTPTPVVDVKTADKEARTLYQLPDGQAVTLSAERYLAPNVLFDPMTFCGSEEPSIADVLVDAIRKSDLELRPKLYQQVVLSGGTTLLPGFGDRLLYHVKTQAPPHTRIRMAAPPQRLHSVFVGGSILASLATFKNMWISRADYEEHGSKILDQTEL